MWDARTTHGTTSVRGRRVECNRAIRRLGHRRGRNGNAVAGNAAAVAANVYFGAVIVIGRITDLHGTARSGEDPSFEEHAIQGGGLLSLSLGKDNETTG